MKHLTPALAIIVWLLAIADAGAQGTAFTYNGRLAVNGVPATGNYDLKFSLYDAPGGGNVIGVLTNSFVGLTNGLFITTLDYGSVFNGTGYWLELAARTNGGTTFTTLAPREPVTPVPYAMYATYAGNVTNGPLGQWSSIGTNAFLGLVTNAASSVVNAPLFSNATAIASLVASNYPWIQYSPPLANGILAQKLSTNGQVTILTIGDSIAFRPGNMMDAFIAQLKARYGDAGHGFVGFQNIAGYLPPFFSPTPFPEGIAFGPYVTLAPGDYAFDFQLWPRPYDKVNLYWMGSTNGGDFQVVFSNNVVGFTTNTLSGRVAGNFYQFYATNFPGAFAGNNGFLVRGLTGTNVIIGASYINSRASGIVDFNFARSGTRLPQYFDLTTNVFNSITSTFPIGLPASNALAEVAQIIKPDMIIYCARDATEASSNQFMSAATQLFSLLQTNANGVNTSVVLVGIYPELDDQNGNPPPTNTFQSNQLKSQLAQAYATNNWYYADIYNYFPSWQQNFDAGLMDDQLHCSPQGGLVFGGLLAKELGLDSVPAASPDFVSNPSTAPIFYAPMSEGNGALTFDYGVSNYAATVDTMLWTNDPGVGPALMTLNNTSTLNFGNVVELNGLLDMTALLWIKPATNALINDAFFFGKWGDNGYGAWQLICREAPGTATLYLVWWDYLGHYHSYFGQPVPQLFDGNWHLVGFDYSVESGTLQIIIDGNYSGTLNGILPSKIGQANLVIGSYENNPTVTGEYGGASIYDRTLSRRELTDLYNAGIRQSAALAALSAVKTGSGVFTNGIASFNNNLAPPTTITIGSSPFSWTNNTGANVFVFVDGGTGSAIRVNGTTVFQSFTGGHTIPLQPREYVTLVYSAAPTGMSWKAQ